MKDKSVVVNEVDRNIQMTINKAVEEFSDDVRTIDDGQTETNEMTKQNLTMKKRRRQPCLMMRKSLSCSIY